MASLEGSALGERPRPGTLSPRLDGCGPDGGTAHPKTPIGKNHMFECARVGGAPHGNAKLKSREFGVVPASGAPYG